MSLPMMISKSVYKKKIKIKKNGFLSGCKANFLMIEKISTVSKLKPAPSTALNLFVGTRINRSNKRGVGMTESRWIHNKTICRCVEAQCVPKLTIRFY